MPPPKNSIKGLPAGAEVRPLQVEGLPEGAEIRPIGDSGGSSPSGSGTGGTPPATQAQQQGGFLNTLGREAGSLYDSVVGLPKAAYHAFTDDPTLDERMRYEPEMNGARLDDNSLRHKVGLGLARMTSQPVDIADEAYRNHRVGYEDALSVAPEALGAGAGGVVGGKLLSKVIPSRALVNPNETLKMPMAPGLAEKAAAVRSAIPKPTTGGAVFHPVASGAELATRGLLSKVSEIAGRTPPDPNLMSITDEIRPSRPQPITAEQAAIDAAREGETGTVHQDGPPMEQVPPPGGPRQSLADRVGIQAGKPEPNISMMAAHEPTGPRLQAPPMEPVANHVRTPLWQQIGTEAGRPEPNIQTVNPPEPTGPRAIAPKPNLMSQVVRGQEEMQPGSFTERRMSPERRGMFETSISELRNKLAGATPEETTQLNTEIERLRTMAREGGAPPTGGPLAAKVAEDTQADNMRLESSAVKAATDKQTIYHGTSLEQAQSIWRDGLLKTRPNPLGDKPDPYGNISDVHGPFFTDKEVAARGYAERPELNPNTDMSDPSQRFPSRQGAILEMDAYHNRLPPNEAYNDSGYAEYNMRRDVPTSELRGRVLRDPSINDRLDDTGIKQTLQDQLERGQAEEQSRSFFRNNKPDVSKTTQSTYAEENPAPKRESPMKAPWGGKFGRSKK